MRLNISVEWRADDNLRTLTEQILAAAGIEADGSGAGMGFRDTEYEVERAEDGEAAALRVAAAFPDRQVLWDVSDAEGNTLAASK